MRLQITCLVVLQPVPMVSCLKAPKNRLFGITIIYIQGVLAKCTFRPPVCLDYSLPLMVFWLKVPSKPPVWLHYSLFPRCFGKKRLHITCLVALQLIPKVFWI